MQAVSFCGPLVNSQNYTFAVNLKDDEYISGLFLRIGENGAVSTGDVHKEADAREIFLQDKASPILNFFCLKFFTQIVEKH